ncbi:hypothetical protein FHG87_012570 [Trinorchestia longiramus]|nr:hypothetical protein FHG87_012570 [Trinorchestia longiramus]
MAPVQTSTATRLGPVKTRSTTLTNERSRSGSRAQLTALYNEAATLCITDFLTSTSKVNISIKNSSPEKLKLQPTAELIKQKPTILSADRMGSNNIHTNKKCTYSNSPHAPTHTSRRPAGKTSARQYSTSRRVQRGTKT